jgi:xylan 1,4-beta-xylosidase
MAGMKWSSTNVYREDTGGSRSRTSPFLDGIFDEYKAAGVVPMIELGFMPKDGDSPAAPTSIKFIIPGRTTAGSVQAPPKDYANGRSWFGW